MKTTTSLIICTLAVTFLLVGCTSRSISNSDYPERSYRHGRPYYQGGYKGELKEVDVLGVDTAQTITEQDISNALASAGQARLVRGNRVLIIQSGAERPDAPMFEAMSQRFTVTEFSGIPSDAGMQEGVNYNKQLRYTAARGGYEKIVCYWGVLESAVENKATKAISWVPIVGGVVPDEKQSMRIRLRAAIIDVKSNEWTMVTPAPILSTDFSSTYTRKSTDQGLVNSLKEQAYKELAKTLADAYTL